MSDKSMKEMLEEAYRQKVPYEGLAALGDRASPAGEGKDGWREALQAIAAAAQKSVNEYGCPQCNRSANIARNALAAPSPRERASQPPVHRQPAGADQDDKIHAALQPPPQETTMHAKALEAIIAVCRQREQQGDCPTVDRPSAETLEFAVLELANQRDGRLRQKILNDPDVDIEAGPDLAEPPPLGERASQPPSVERIVAAHSMVTKENAERGANHGDDLGWRHREYRQGSDEGCYFCALLDEIARLRASQPPEGEEELPDDIRVPLHELMADAAYLFGRVAADGSCAGVMTDAVTNKLTRLEIAIRTALSRSHEGREGVLREALEDVEELTKESPITFTLVDRIRNTVRRALKEKP